MSKFTDIHVICDVPVLKVLKDFTVDETYNDKHDTSYSFSRKYLGIMQFGITFYANHATYQQAVNNAERMIHRALNRDALVELDKLKALSYKYVDPELEATINNVIYLVDGGE